MTCKVLTTSPLSAGPFLTHSRAPWRPAKSFEVYDLAAHRLSVITTISELFNGGTHVPLPLLLRPLQGGLV
jgi:hypothetical protein